MNMDARKKFENRVVALVSAFRSGEFPPEIAGNRDYVIEELEQMLESARKENLPAREHRRIGLARLVVDQWPAHELGDELVKVEALYERL